MTVDTTLTFISYTNVLGPSRIEEKTILILVHSAILYPFCVCLPRLHGSGSGYPGIVILFLFLVLWYWNIEWRWHLLKKSRCWKRQLDELMAQMIEVRQQSSSTATSAAVSGLAEAVRTMGQSVSKPRPEDMRVGKPEPCALGKDFDNWDFTFNGYAGTLDPAYPALLKTARQSPTVVMATLPHEQQSATLMYLLTMLTQQGARKVVRKDGCNGFEAYRQLCLVYGTSDQESSTGKFVQILTYKFGSKIEDVEDRLNEFLELVRRYDEANGTDPVPDQVKKACIISNTPEPLKTHLQLYVGKKGNFNALRVAWRLKITWGTDASSRRSAGNTHDEDSMEVDAVSRKVWGRRRRRRRRYSPSRRCAGC